MINVKSVGLRDLGALKDVDLKASIYPATSEAWVYAIDRGNCVNYGAYIGIKMVGFVILEQAEKVLKILRLKVHPQFKYQNVEETLLAKASDLARDLHIYTLEITVPEIHCLPGDPDDESVFLKGHGFTAYRVVKDAFKMYGRAYDGFVFKKGV